MQTKIEKKYAKNMTSIKTTSFVKTNQNHKVYH